MTNRETLLSVIKMKIEKTDLFRKLIEDGNLKQSGLNKKFNPYRVFEFQGKEFKLTLETKD